MVGYQCPAKFFKVSQPTRHTPCPRATRHAHAPPPCPCATRRLCANHLHPTPRRQARLAKMRRRVRHALAIVSYVPPPSLPTRRHHRAPRASTVAPHAPPPSRPTRLHRRAAAPCTLTLPSITPPPSCPSHPHHHARTVPSVILHPFGLLDEILVEQACKCSTSIGGPEWRDQPLNSMRCKGKRKMARTCRPWKELPRPPLSSLSPSASSMSTNLSQ